MKIEERVIAKEDDIDRKLTELIRREQYDVDAREVRRYFDFTRVRAGLLEVTGQLFGLEYRQVDVPRWHEDVTAYDVYAEGERRGLHAAMDARAGRPRPW